jgi:hypothetical protein
MDILLEQRAEAVWLRPREPSLSPPRTVGGTDKQPGLGRAPKPGKQLITAGMFVAAISGILLYSGMLTYISTTTPGSTIETLLLTPATAQPQTSSTASPQTEAATASPQTEAATASPQTEAATAPPQTEAATAPPQTEAATAPPQTEAATAPPQTEAATAPPQTPSAAPPKTASTAPSRAARTALRRTAPSTANQLNHNEVLYKLRERRTGVGY